MPQHKAGKGSNNLGRAMIKNRFQSKRPSDQWISPPEANFTSLNKAVKLKSTTDATDLDEFLASATLAGTEFEAERFNIKLIAPDPRQGVLSTEETHRIKELHETYKQFLSIPRRPHWEKSTAPADLDVRERTAFMEWRKQLSEIAEVEGLVVTPYEKNLEVWRQLWRVLERSDTVVQIVDARNPLLYYCEDLAKYVAEIDAEKDRFILINKGDMLSEPQRQKWADYFNEVGLKAAFFSALQASEADTPINKPDGHDNEKSSEEMDQEKDMDESEGNPGSESDDEWTDEEGSEATEPRDTLVPDGTSSGEPVRSSAGEKSADVARFSNGSYLCTSRVLSRDDLLGLFKTLHRPKSTVLPGVTTVGFVGYPNVGKSSTLNALMQHKMVSVSATPGKTKHFQTMYVDKSLMLCDCPGLVMPSFAMSAAEMIVNGILPIDQLRDPCPPVNLICSRFSRIFLEGKYGIQLPFIKEYGVDYEIIPPPTAEEFLGAYADMRGFGTGRALPDISRSARHILKDYVNGHLLYCHAPPGSNQEEFGSLDVDVEHAPSEIAHDTLVKHDISEQSDEPTPFLSHDVSAVSVDLPGNSRSGRVDREFFAESAARIYEKRGGISKVRGPVPATEANSPDRKHFKKNKKEKLRRTFRHLDVH